MRQVARKIHARRETSLFLKLDITKAFDALAWPFLFEILRANGFGAGWIRWIAILLQTSNTKVLVNGVPGRRFHHAKGLRQGDPVSPLLFVIAMDSLAAIINKAREAGVISTLNGISPVQRLSIYADDLALFIKPSVQDLHFVRQAFGIFGEASGLQINYGKSSVTLIRGDESDRLRVQNMLHCNLGSFPCRYLGLPLAINKLTRADWQPLLDQVRKFIPAWQRGFIQRPGRLILVKSVIAARLIHQLMVLNPPGWVLEEIDRWMRSFLQREDKRRAMSGCLGHNLPPNMLWWSRCKGSKLTGDCAEGALGVAT